MLNRNSNVSLGLAILFYQNFTFSAKTRADLDTTDPRIYSSYNIAARSHLDRLRYITVSILHLVTGPTLEIILYMFNI